MNLNWKNIFKNINKCILLIFIVNLFLGIQINYAKAETKDKIKVGYSNIYGFSRIENGYYDGVLFEYLDEIAKYTGWEYEFIEIDLDDINNKVKEGEVDIVGGIFKNEANEQLYDFPEYIAGNTYTTLVISKNNKDINISNMETLDGIKVGYFERDKNKLEKFKIFCEFNKIKNIEFIQYSSQNGNELNEALKLNEVDAIISSDYLIKNDEKVIYKFLATPYYFATKKGNYDIISKLNTAIFKIKQKNPEYEQLLYNKYFKKVSENTISLNKEEKDYINNLGVLKAIYVDNNIPTQYYNNKTKKADGIYIDLLSLIMKKIGIKFEFIRANNYEEAYTMIKNKEADLIIAVPDVQSLSDEHNLFLTQYYFDVEVVEVRNKYSKDDKEILALVNGYGYPELMDCDEIKYYKTLKECFEAVEKGEATKTFSNNYSVLHYASSDYYSNLLLLYIDDKINTSIGFSKPIDRKMINIINKAIDNLSLDEVNNIVYENISSVNHKITLKELVIENTHLFVLISLALGLSISIIVMYRFKKLKETKKKLLKKSQTDPLTGIYNRNTGEQLIRRYLNEKSSDLYFTFTIIDIDYFKQVNDRLGHQVGDKVLKEFSSRLKEFFCSKCITYRLGGDEFIVFIKDIKKDNINSIEPKLNILCDIMNKDIEHNNIKQRISLSIGCVISNKSTDFDDLYKKADDMLYKVKHNGKNGFKIERDFIC